MITFAGNSVYNCANSSGAPSFCDTQDTACCVVTLLWVCVRCAQRFLRTYVMSNEKSTNMFPFFNRRMESFSVKAEDCEERAAGVPVTQRRQSATQSSIAFYCGVYLVFASLISYFVFLSS